MRGSARRESVETIFGAGPWRPPRLLQMRGAAVGRVGSVPSRWAREPEGKESGYADFGQGLTSKSAVLEGATAEAWPKQAVVIGQGLKPMGGAGKGGTPVEIEINTSRSGRRRDRFGQAVVVGLRAV